MAKIVIIGAGSHVFSRHLITDILTWPELRDGTISLMDISQEPLDLIAGFARRLVKQNGFKTKIEATTKRREALDGADYVFVTIQVGGSKATWPDRELPRKYGVDQAVGDTTGVGGVFYGTRHVPVILDICRDMAELCPNAWLLSYTNPMAIICWRSTITPKLKMSACATACRAPPPNWRNTSVSRSMSSTTGSPELTIWPGSWN